MARPRSLGWILSDAGDVARSAGPSVTYFGSPSFRRGENIVNAAGHKGALPHGWSQILSEFDLQLPATPSMAVIRRPNQKKRLLPSGTASVLLS